MTTSTSQGRDSAGLRRHNVRVLLRHLHLHGPTSRARLGKITGLTRSAIADLVGELAERGLAMETGPSQTQTGRGRPPLIVAPSHERAKVLAVAVEVDTIRIRRIGLGGALLDGTELPHDAAPGDTVRSVRLLTELINTWIADEPEPPIALGVAVPGLVRAEDGMVARAPNLAWHELDLGEQLRAGTGLAEPVVVGNEARLAGLAEHLRGAGRQCGDLVYISAGVGVGGGIITRNRLLTGSTGYGGELGHMITHPGGRRCHCGGRGCWETEIGADALLRHAGVPQPTDRHAALDELFAGAARGGDALEALRALCVPVATGIANLVNVFNPERVVLGGLLQPLAHHLADELRETLDELRGLPELPVELRPAELGADGRVLGAAETALDSFLNQLG